MLDEFVHMSLFEVNGKKNLLHDHCVHKRRVKFIQILLAHIIVRVHDTHRKRILSTLTSSLFESLIHWLDFSEDTFDLRPFFVVFFILTED